MVPKMFRFPDAIRAKRLVLDMYYSLNSLQGVIEGTHSGSLVGAIKGDTWSSDCSSHDSNTLQGIGKCRFSQLQRV